MARKIQLVRQGELVPKVYRRQTMSESSREAIKGSDNSCDGFIHRFYFDDIAGNQELQNAIREIVESGYAKIGGTRVPVEVMFADTASRYSVFSLSEDENQYDAFCATAIHKVNNHCPQLRCIAGRGQFRSQGVYALVEYEMANEGYCFLAEVSGAIEHFYAKCNSFIVPNIYAKKVLRLTNKQFVIDDDDLFHYEHIYSDGRRLRKVLYGFRDRKQFESLVENIKDNVNTWDEFGDYETYRQRANSIISQIANRNESVKVELDEFEVYDILDCAIMFVDRLYDEQHYEQYNEYPEQVFEQAEFMLHVVKELGTTQQYEESIRFYSHWLSKVSKLELLTI